MKNIVIVVLIFIIIYLLYSGGAFEKLFSDPTKLPPHGPGAPCIVNNANGVSVQGTFNQNGVCIPNQ